MVPHRRALLVLLTAGMLLVAGCGGGGTGTATEPVDTTATTPVGTTATATDPATTEPAGTATETATPAYREVSVDPAAVKQDALAAMRAIDTYRITFENTRTVEANRVSREVDITSRGAFNRTARELRVNRTVSGPAGSVNVRTYVTNRTLYERSPAYVRRYDAKWIRVDLGGNVSTRWELLDTLTRQRTILNVSTVSVLGGTTVSGSDAYVLRADVNETAYTDLIQARLDAATDVNVTDATFTFWIDAETGRPLRSAGTVNSTAVINGQVVSVHEEFELRFRAYDEPVTITLPPEADTAVAVGNTTESDA